MNKYEPEIKNEEHTMPLLSLVFYRTCSLTIQQQQETKNIPDYEKDQDQQEAPCTLHK